mgnify:CR=1 FL=1
MAEYDRKYIEWLKEQPIENLTSEQRRLRNLNPIKNGEVRNPNGAKKGSKHWSTYFQKMMDDPEFFKTFVKSIPKEWTDIDDNSSAKAIAAAVVSSTTKKCLETAAKGEEIDKDTREMIALLNKVAYGDKVVYSTDDSFFNSPVINFNVVPDREEKTEQQE